MKRLNSFQVAFFCNNISFGNKLDYASKIIKATDEVFDGEPAILPIPVNAPPEIPRIVVRSKDKKFICNTSVNRVDLIFNPKNDTERDLSSIQNNYFDVLIQIINYLNEEYRVKIFRMGIVANIIIELEESSNSFIVKKYLKDNSLISNTYITQLHFLNKIKLLNRYEANRWLRLITLRKLDDTENDKALNITIDTNTLQDENHDFDRELVTMIFKDALKDMQDLISKHFEGA